MKLIVATVLLALAADGAAAQGVPLPRSRPAPTSAGDTQSEPAAPPVSACRLRLTPKFAIAPSVAAVVGPGECGDLDLVRLEAVVLPDMTQVALSPPATLRCTMAEAIANWVREDLAPQALDLGAALRSVQNYAAYHCRGRNNIAGAPVSEHGKGNALDIRSLRLADNRVIDPTDPKVSKDFREAWRKSVCARFNTVLGPGSDGYHENHIHVDLMQRRNNGYKMCQWDVRVPEEKPAATDVAATIPLPPPRPKIDAATR